MSLYPDVQKKAQKELDRVVGPNRLPDFDDYDESTSILEQHLNQNDPDQDDDESLLQIRADRQQEVRGENPDFLKREGKRFRCRIMLSMGLL